MAGILIGSALLLGILLGGIDAGWFALPALASGAVLAAAVRRERRTAAIAALAFVCVLAGFWRASAASTPTQVDLPSVDYRYQGIVVGVPSRSGSGGTARVSLRDPAGGTAWVVLPSVPEVHQSDVIMFHGLVERDVSRPDPETLLPSGPRGAPVIFASQLTVLGSEASMLERSRSRMLEALRGRLERSIPEPGGALSAGVLLGDDGDLTTYTGDAFRAAGLSHLTAVSGWNVALVAGMLAILTARLCVRRVWVLALSALGIWAFAYLVGLGPSVLRAAVMGTLLLVAGWRGRPADALTSLVWTSAAMVLLQPGTLHDIGFQLSAAATLAIVVTAPLLEGAARWVAAAAVPIAAELAVAPLILHQFGTYSLVAPLANVVVAPLVPAVMAGALVTGVASLVHPLLASAAGLVTWVPARLITVVAEWAASAPGLTGHTIPLGWGGVLVAYLVLAAVYAGHWYARFGRLARRAPAGV